MTEIERKFLVTQAKLPELSQFKSFTIAQAYIQNEPFRSVRVRIKGDKAFLTIKSGKNALSRLEFEYEIPVVEAQEMMDKMELKSLSKTRYIIPFEGKTWELDVFHGKLAGLIVAEIELTDENETFALPEWIGEEVTHDSAYLNANLIKQL